jgi:WD40 repeat protein
LITGPDLVFSGHGYSVNNLVFSPDGKLAISSSTDKAVKVWDVPSGKCKATLEGHAATVTAVALTADGSKIISVSHDETIRVWTLKGKVISSWNAGSTFLNSVVLIPGEPLVIVGDEANNLKVWNIDTKACVATWKGHSGAIRSVVVSEDGKRAVSASKDRTLRVWNPHTGKSLGELKGHKGWVNSVRIANGGQWAVSASNDKMVKIWDLHSKTCIKTLEGHRSYVESVAISPDLAMIVSGSSGIVENGMRVWDRATGVCRQVIKSTVLCGPHMIEFSPNGSQLFAEESGRIRVFNLPS